MELPEIAKMGIGFEPVQSLRHAVERAAAAALRCR